jgi:uncharacterized RDD family membrane protein YckC
VETLDSFHPVERKLSFAGFWIRTAAMIIDVIIIGILFFLSALTVGLLMTLHILKRGAAERSLYFNISMIVVGSLAVLYFIAMESYIQGTLGKIAVGIRVGKLDGRRISFVNSTGRYLARSLSGILGIGYFMIFFNKKKQSLHDKLAKTFVFYR